MTEHLFKLTKYGKTVGYMKIVGGAVLYKHPPAEKWANAWLEWKTAIICFDTAHPFVTKDKNGKDVFARDLLNYDCCGDFHEKGIGYFVWDDDVAGWRLQDAEKKKRNFYYGSDFNGSDFRSEDIELIEDKDNE